MAHCKFAESSGQKLFQDSWNMVTIKNLSAGGALFLFNQQLPAQTPVELKINFPLSKTGIVCSGQVVRVDPSPTPNLFGIAVRFIAIAEEDRSLIERLARSI